MGKKARRPEPNEPASLKLQIELVPKRLWEQNLRSSEGLGKARWDKLRRKLIKERGARCEICGAIGQRLNGHEVRDCREKKTAGTAVLLKIEIVCVDFHLMIAMEGRRQRGGLQDVLNVDLR